MGRTVLDGSMVRSELRAAFVKKLRKIEREQSISVRDFAQRYGLR